MKNSKIRKKLYAEPSEAKKNTEILKRVLKTSILGPQNLRSWGPGPPGSAPALLTVTYFFGNSTSSYPINKVIQMV